MLYQRWEYNLFVGLTLVVLYEHHHRRLPHLIPLRPCTTGADALKAVAGELATIAATPLEPGAADMSASIARGQRIIQSRMLHLAHVYLMGLDHVVL